MHLDAVVCLCDSQRLLRTFEAPAPPPPPSGNVSGSGTESCTRGTEDLKDDIGLSLGGGEVKEDRSSSVGLVMSQLALSDRVLLNKSDLITPEEVSARDPFLSVVVGRK